ncbi:sodium-dependent transporter [Spongiibacter sp. KMU-158]|uniref:Transporter n=1 Tax=Spongiibacter pelagi TaxID=2760804 RepID=A0A927GXB1_9GAMM|nr:sodium-dependent transporter [Spongiibacter pelagi]MBD2859983.1 sodium-dependent transporter [Spongiibacter pelagi]
MASSTDNTSVTWKSRWTFILAATGSAVGLGNIWKFPYITGEYGGGAFVLVYLACILLIGIPVMIAEVMAGRAGRADPAHSMKKLALESNHPPYWVLVGLIGMMAGLMIMMFYSVVAGWALEYVSQSITGQYAQQTPEEIEASFSALLASEPRQLVWHTLFSIMTGLVVAAGVTKGIGRTVDVLMPLLFICILLLIAYSFFEGDFSAGFHFMFDADFSRLSGEAVLVAMGHAFFTLSLGMGAIMAYGAYFPGNASIGKTVLAIAGMDTLIALMAGLAMFPLVFANDLTPGQGPGLMFVTLPIAFSNLPGGVVVGGIFFFLVSVAALSSSISLIEPGVAGLEKMGLPRRTSTLLLVIIAWIGGIASIQNGAVFDALDYITANIMLPLGGLLIAVFVGWVIPKPRVLTETGMSDGLAYRAWYFSLRFIAPLGIVVVFLNSLGLFKG